MKDAGRLHLNRSVVWTMNTATDAGGWVRGAWLVVQASCFSGRRGEISTSCARDLIRLRPVARCCAFGAQTISSAAGADAKETGLIGQHVPHFPSSQNVD